MLDYDGKAKLGASGWRLRRFLPGRFNLIGDLAIAKAPRDWPI
jgi:hypothetical protein